MKKVSIVFVFLFNIITLSLLAQTSNKINGKVINDKNEPLSGVTIKIEGAAGGTSTDLEGRYTLTLPVGKKITLLFSAIGYKLKSIADVEATNGATDELDVVLERDTKKLQDVVVTSTSVRRESVNSLIQYQKNTNTVASVISAEAIRRSPDRNTGEVLKRTPGTSIQDGRFLVVRGLADRYNIAMLNGILLSSTEPDRKAFSFDLIPANMIDNIVINKAFVPELPGEWAGGLIQINTRDIPAKSFFNVQVGTGINTQSHFNDFYSYKGGKTDWLGIDDGTRALPAGYTTKSKFDALSSAEKTEIGKQFSSIWAANKTSAPVNAQFQASGGFNVKMKGSKQLGGIFGITYNRAIRYTKNTNSTFNFDFINQSYTPDFALNDDKYAQDVLWGALGNITYQFSPNHRISYKTLFNISSTDYTTIRTGRENFSNNELDQVRANELTFKQNTFYNNQVSGDHNLFGSKVKFKWYGSFNILDGYAPDQRRIYYTQRAGQADQPYTLLLSNSLSQKSGNRFYQNLSDYIYTAGGDVAYNFNALGFKQTLKAGYMFQVKDRLFDSKPFSVYIPYGENLNLKQQSPETIFSQENFGNGSTTSNLFAFDAIKNINFRYLANTILNAGFLQFDNQVANKIRVIWGLRIEDYDQLIGSTRKSDPRYNYVQTTDFLPGINATYKVNNLTNIRLSASQTVIRPEFRELASLNYYDFDLNASVQGNPELQRTKVTNFDARYELYPRAGELFTLGAFYKHFDNPIEQKFEYGVGGASTYQFKNPKNATAYGVELEFRKKLNFEEALKNFTFQSNISFINSKVKDTALQIDRPLQGQSTFVFNAGLMYDLEKAGINATLLYNQVGKRIAFVGSTEQPDIYESSRPLFDFQLSKKIIKNKGEIKLNVQDILNRKLYFYQNADGNTALNKGTDPYRFTRQFGTTINIVFGYSL